MQRRRILFVSLFLLVALSACGLKRGLELPEGKHKEQPVAATAPAPTPGIPSAATAAPAPGTATTAEPAPANTAAPAPMSNPVTTP